jgi:hypothetical protein
LGLHNLYLPFEPRRPSYHSILVGTKTDDTHSPVSMPRAAPSREAPSASQDLEAGTVLKLGEYADQPTLNTSEARIILKKTLDARRARNHNAEETETLAKTRDYLELFAVFKEIEEAQQVESIIDTYAKDIARFEKSQLGESTWLGRCRRCI